METAKPQMTKAEILVELNRHPVGTLLEINKELCYMIRDKQAQASTIAKYQFQVGDIVEFDSRKGHITGTITKLLRTSAIVRTSEGYSSYRVPCTMLQKSEKKVNKGHDAVPGTGTDPHDTDVKSAPIYIRQKIRMAEIFSKDGKKVGLPTTEAEIMEYFEGLQCDLSPENLTCDGELSQAQVQKKQRDINEAWKWLEYRLGRKVTDSEIDSRVMSRNLGRN